MAQSKIRAWKKRKRQRSYPKHSSLSDFPKNSSSTSLSPRMAKGQESNCLNKFHWKLTILAKKTYGLDQVLTKLAKRKKGEANQNQIGLHHSHLSRCQESAFTKTTQAILMTLIPLMNGLLRT